MERERDRLECRQQRSGEKETGPSPEQRRSGDRAERDRSVNGGIARKRPAGEESSSREPARRRPARAQSREEAATEERGIDR